MSEFVQQVLEIHRERESIERSVLDAVEANCGIAVTPDYWTSMRQLVADRHQAGSIEG